MADWRERGYVPDSDDDGEEAAEGSALELVDRENGSPRLQPGSRSKASASLTEETNTVPGSADTDDGLKGTEILYQQQNPREEASLGGNDAPRPQIVAPQSLSVSFHHLQNAPSPVAAKLQAELQKGLQTVNDILGPLNEDDQDDTDSPLSSLPSSLRSSPPRGSPAFSRPILPANFGALRELSSHDPSRQLAIAAARSLRARAPIQLHPYALEDARYRKSLKDRGLQPVRLPTATEKPQEASEEDSQGADTYESSQAAQTRDSSPPKQSGDDESQSPIRATRVKASALDFSYDDDLPELSDILKGRPTQTLSVSIPARKRPRRPRALPGPPPATNEEYRIYDLPEDDGPFYSDSRHDSGSLNIPPSPPQSHGALSSQDALLPSPGEVLPGQSTPGFLPTPLLSSDRHYAKRTFVEPDSSSESETNVISDDSSDSSTASESSKDDSQGVQRLRRRIKGVLPASWLKLNNKQPKSVHVPRSHGQSPLKSGVEKGVAQRRLNPDQRILKGDRSRTSLETADFQESESDSDEPMIEADHVYSNMTGAFDDDIMEDNAVDAMLAPRSRKTASVRKTQQRLNDAWLNSETMASVAGHVTGGRIQGGVNKTAANKPKVRRPPRKRTKRSHQRPRMTVLDAPGFKDNEVPRFLRVATRRKRGLAQQTAQNPATKFFKLATLGDTLDVQKELDRWAGRRRKTSSSFTNVADSASAPSKPAPRRMNDTGGGNTTSRFDEAIPQLTALKEATNATLERLRDNQNRPRATPPAGAANPQSQSTVLLNFFEPRRAHRSRLQLPRRKQDGEYGASPSENNEATLPKATKARAPLQRVPKPALGGGEPRRTIRREEPLPGPATPACPRKPRRLRKHRPMPLRPSNRTVVEQMDVEDLVSNDFQGLDLQEDTDVLSQAISNPPGTTLLHQELLLQNSILFNDLLPGTVAAMADMSRLLRPGGAYSLITVPIGECSTPCTGWSRDIEANIHQAFTQIASILCNNTASEHGFGTEENLLLLMVTRSVETLIAYNNESLWFLNEVEVNEFIMFISAKVDMLLGEIDFYERARRAPNVIATLSVLNRLVVFAYQISRISALAGVDQAARSNFSASCQRLFDLAWSLALRKDHVAHLFSRLADHSGNQFALEALGMGDSDMEIETIVLIHRLSSCQSWATSLHRFLSSHVDVGSVKHPAEILAYVILILGCLYSGIGKDELTIHGPKADESLIYSGFAALSSAVNEFLRSFLHEKMKQKGKKKTTELLMKLERFGLVAFQWCLVLAQSASRDVTDNLLKQMFKNYSDRTNNMLDLFTTTSIEVPAFLVRQVPASELTPEPADTDFHLFLKLVASTLEVSADSNFQSAAQLRKLGLRKLSLVFSLLPNNGRDIGNDNPLLVDEYQPLKVQDLAAMANRYILFSTLYHYSPTGFKPALSKVKDLVEFGKAHDAVCTLVLQCWASIVKSAVSQPVYTTELHELATWIQDMMFQISDKLRQLPQDKGGRPHSGDGGKGAEFQANHRNRLTANSRLYKIAETYSKAMDLCLNESQAISLVTGDRLNEILLLCDQGPWLDDAAISRIFGVLTSALKKCHAATGFVPELRQQVRRVLVAQLSRNNVPDDVLLMSMVEAWFTIARIMVKEGNENWDNYLSNWGSHSFSRIAGTEIGRHCHILLLSKVVTDRTVLDADPYFFLDAWLSSILLPEADIKFEHHLTNQLLETAADVLDLDDLRRRISNGTPKFFFTREDLVQNRLEIVRHMIRSIHNLQYADGEPPYGPLKKSQAERLLGVITASMKYTWQQLPGEARPAWTAFIHDIVLELSTHPFPNFKIDPWFIDTNEDEFDDKTLYLERLFILRRGCPDELDHEHAVKVFRLACGLACDNNRKARIVEQLSTTFSADSFNCIDDKGQFLLDIPAQFYFLQAVLPAYIERALTHATPLVELATPVVAMATSILQRLETRVDLEEQDQMERFARVILSFLVAAVKAVQRTPCDFVNSLGCELEMLARLVSLCAMACSRWAHLHQLFPTSCRILELQPFVQTYGMYMYEYACSSIDLDCVPSDALFWDMCPDKRMRSARNFGFDLSEPQCMDDGDVVCLREFAVNDLVNSSRTDWMRLRVTESGPVWRYNPPGRAPLDVEPDTVDSEEGKGRVTRAVAELVGVLVFLGVK